MKIELLFFHRQTTVKIQVDLTLCRPSTTVLQEEATFTLITITVPFNQSHGQRKRAQDKRLFSLNCSVALFDGISQAQC